VEIKKKKDCGESRNAIDGEKLKSFRSAKALRGDLVSGLKQPGERKGGAPYERKEDQSVEE